MPKINRSNGNISIKAKSRMTNAINWMVYLSENKMYYSKKTKQTHKLALNFITLTLCSAQMHNDEYIKKHMLEPFLKWLKRKGNDLYVWRAETQANSNIHFHITSNRYICYKSVQIKWNDLLHKHGYIRAYIAKGGDANPPSTQVKGVKDIRKMAGYMVKYLSKEDSSRRPVTCKVWSCSTALMNKRRCIDEFSEHFAEAKTTLEKHCDKKNMEAITVYLYRNNKTRDYLMKLQLYAEAFSELYLWNEKERTARISARLGAAQPQNKNARQIHMPTLWSEAK